MLNGTGPKGRRKTRIKMTEPRKNCLLFEQFTKQMFPGDGIEESLPQITKIVISDILKHYKRRSHWNQFFNKTLRITSKFGY